MAGIASSGGSGGTAPLLRLGVVFLNFRPPGLHLAPPFSTSRTEPHRRHPHVPLPIQPRLLTRCSAPPSWREGVNFVGFSPGRSSILSDSLAAGLLSLSRQESSFRDVMGIWVPEQVGAWRPVVDAVHAMGGQQLAGELRWPPQRVRD
nr:uncharacterized protein LOC123493919 [Aegilops tauschii subsp. strangulata]